MHNACKSAISVHESCYVNKKVFFTDVSGVGLFASTFLLTQRQNALAETLSMDFYPLICKHIKMLIET